MLIRISKVILKSWKCKFHALKLNHKSKGLLILQNQTIFQKP